MLSVGAFVEGELYLSWMHFFQARSCLYSFSCFILLFVFASSFSFFYSRVNQRTLPVMVTRVDNVTHKYFHRDEKGDS
jgi:hypothetical protein